ncbi:PepSY-associated TM helix domain-containing protein [Psychrobacter sp. I-STPA10]|uniref:PepSY-associated TM helix domain-containing protein n=1 Tax=Psychrobacter sp. I-STPA10 TaxID=2585769 RepID=UPI001E439AC8|nr:PepSY-associated TM helix domain-containing protein [Psychrobacter sp. I-STPA10]
MTNIAPKKTIQAKKDKNPKWQPKPKGYRQIMSEVHTWFGLLLGWLLFTIFIMGTVSYFNDDLTAWMQPEIAPLIQTTTAQTTIQSSTQSSLLSNTQSSISPPSPTQSLTSKIDSVTAYGLAIQHLQATHPNATSWYIANLDNYQRLEIDAEIADDYLEYQFDTQNQTLYHPRETEGGNFFYRMHFDLHYLPTIWARLIVGFAAMMMLIAIITGIIVHKKIFTDFFTFRWGKGQRSWLDAHNGLSVLPLPFHIMITFTGIITLITLYMPWSIVVSGIDKEQAYQQLYSYRAADTEATDLQATPMTDVTALIAQTKADWQQRNPDYDISRIRINHPNTNQSLIMIDGKTDKQLADISIFRIYDGKTGILQQQSDPPPMAVTTQAVMVGLHAGRFSDYWLRWLYFLLGASGCGMIATGMVLWTVKRRRQLTNPDKPYFGFWLVEKLNIATLVGLPLAMVGYLWLNRLLPIDMNARADWEVNGFFIIWGVSLIMAMMTPNRYAWRAGLSLVATLLLLTPIMNAITTNRGFIHSISQHDILFLSFDGAFISLAGLFFFISYRVKCKQQADIAAQTKTNKQRAAKKHPSTKSPASSDSNLADRQIKKEVSNV